MSVDFVALGLLVALAGGFLLANSVVFRPWRTFVADVLGTSVRRLPTIREHLFRRVQAVLGTLLLLLGLALQLFGRHRDLAGESGAAQTSLPWLLVGGVVLAVVALELGLWFLARSIYRRALTEHFLAHPPDLESDLDLARELGDLYGIASREGDSVQSYLLRIRQRIGHADAARPRRAERARVVLEVEEEAEVG